MSKEDIEDELLNSVLSIKNIAKSFSTQITEDGEVNF